MKKLRHKQQNNNNKHNQYENRIFERNLELLLHNGHVEIDICVSVILLVVGKESTFLSAT